MYLQLHDISCSYVFAHSYTYVYVWSIWYISRNHLVKLYKIVQILQENFDMQDLQERPFCA